MKLTLDILIFLVSFIFVWKGSGLVIKSVDKISRRLKVSSFAFSFFLLGILTSVSEISVALASLSAGTPEVSIGNIIGGIIVIFFLIIPMFAVLGNGIKITTKVRPIMLIFAFMMFTTPLVSVLDQKLTMIEAVFMLFFAIIFIFNIQKNKGVLDDNNNILDLKRYSIRDVFKIILGIIIVFVACNIIVEKTISFGKLLGISPFVISLIILSIGTNLPELSLVFRALKDKKKDVAFGNYLGSATMSIIILSFLIFLSGGKILIINNFWKILVVTVIGFGLFFHFTRSKNDLSRKEGLVLLLVYLTFLAVETTTSFG